MKKTKSILVFNVGSSSIKFGLYTYRSDETSATNLLRGKLSDIGSKTHFTVADPTGRLTTNEVVKIADQRSALAYLSKWLRTDAVEFRPIAIGHRIVHGGLDHQVPIFVNQETSEQLYALSQLAPLHQNSGLNCMEFFREQWPDMPQIACFDTAFHYSMPMQEKLFALPKYLSSEGVRRYGFHGLSYEHISNILPAHLGDAAEKKIVVAHLGQGVSMCAMNERRSIATSMSFTPLDGLPMATRCGSIDPAVILYLIREKNMAEAEISDLLHNRSGLLGLSGISGDVRTLLASKDPAAAQAIDFFVHHVCRELGSMAACLGGLDALVFTGGIGENSSNIRARICNRAAWLGIQLDETANAAQQKCISQSDSSISVWSLPTDEEFVIAQHVAGLMSDNPAFDRETS